MLEMPMRRLASIVAVFLLLTSVTPVLACVMGGPMSSKESACCHSLKRECTKMETMGCCRSEFRTDQATQIVVTSPATESHPAYLAQSADLAATVETVVVGSLRVPIDHSPPPGFLSAKITVLRI
jgi:hypothetical protein